MRKHIKKHITFILVLSLALSGMLFCDNSCYGTAAQPSGYSKVSSFCLQKSGKNSIKIKWAGKSRGRWTVAYRYRSAGSWNPWHYKKLSRQSRSLRIKARKNRTYQFKVKPYKGRYSYCITARTGNSRRKNIRKLTLSTYRKTLKEGQTLHLYAKLYPLKKRVSSQITWVSSRPEIATVNKYGFIKCKKAGKTSIYARAHNGRKSRNCKITVKKRQAAKKPPAVDDNKDNNRDPNWYSDKISGETFTIRGFARDSRCKKEIYTSSLINPEDIYVTPKDCRFEEAMNTDRAESKSKSLYCGLNADSYYYRTLSGIDVKKICYIFYDESGLECAQMTATWEQEPLNEYTGLPQTSVTVTADCLKDCRLPVKLTYRGETIIDTVIDGKVSDNVKKKLEINQTLDEKYSWSSQAEPKDKLQALCTAINTEYSYEEMNCFSADQIMLAAIGMGYRSCMVGTCADVFNPEAGRIEGNIYYAPYTFGALYCPSDEGYEDNGEVRSSAHRDCVVFDISGTGQYYYSAQGHQ